MDFINEFRKFENENYHSYIWRMDELIQSGKYRNWKEIASFVNKELFGDDESQYRDESAFRKACKYARDFKDAGVFGTDDEYFDKLRLEKQELQKAKQQLSDERVEFNRQIRKEARKESYVDMVKRIICEDVEPMNISVHYKLFNSETDLLCHLMEQFKYISELISAMLVKLANNFNHIYVYTTPGNHSRVVAKKEESLDGENMDVLLPFYLKARLQNVENVSICDNVIEPEIAMFTIRGNNVFSAHGHKDNPANVVQNFTMMFGIKPDIVLLGHRHTNGLTTVYDTKVIESGCVSGSDQFALSIRKVNRPEQTVSVIGENGLICLYDIKLDD